MPDDDPPYGEFAYNAPPGACEPEPLFFRIYPEEDFNQLFGNPPPSVITG